MQNSTEIPSRDTSNPRTCAMLRNYQEYCAFGILKLTISVAEESHRKN